MHKGNNLNIQTETAYHVKELINEAMEKANSVYNTSIQSQEQAKEIAVGSLLHDIGMRYIEVDIVNKDLDDMSAYEVSEYKKHPVYGYSAVENEEWISMRNERYSRAYDAINTCRKALEKWLEK